jgi:hypothetical protein
VTFYFCINLYIIWKDKILYKMSKREREGFQSTSISQILGLREREKIDRFIFYLCVMCVYVQGSSQCVSRSVPIWIQFVVLRYGRYG